MGIPAVAGDALHEERGFLLAIRDLYLSYKMIKEMKVELNGALILDIVLERPDSNQITLLLKPVTRELLTSGNNTLSVKVTPGGKGFEAELKQGR